MKKVLLLGASGSIGSQTLDIIRQYPNDFELVGFSVGKNYEKAKEILLEFKNVKYVFITQKEDVRSIASSVMLSLTPSVSSKDVYCMIRLFFGS